MTPTQAPSTVDRFTPTLSFAALCVVSVALWFRTLLQTISLAIGNDKYTHLLLILPVTVALILLQWNWSRVEFQPSIWGGGLLLLSLLVAGLARWGSVAQAADVQLWLNMIALVGWWIGAFALCFGRRTARASVFPLAFLLWMVPIPALALDHVISWLQHGSALAAELLFSLAGTAVSRQGLILAIPGLEIEVAPECSSIRSSLMLIVTTMALAQILLRSPRRKLLVVVVAIPLSIAKNGLRIFTIGWLGTHVDPSFLDGRLHHHGGVVFFAVALAGIFLLIWLLQRGESREDVSDKWPPPAGATGPVNAKPEVAPR